VFKRRRRSEVRFLPHHKRKRKKSRNEQEEEEATHNAKQPGLAKRCWPLVRPGLTFITLRLTLAVCDRKLRGVKGHIL